MESGTDKTILALRLDMKIAISDEPVKSKTEMGQRGLVVQPVKTSDNNASWICRVPLHIYFCLELDLREHCLQN